MDEETVKNVTQEVIDHFDSETGLDREDHEALWKSRTKMTWIALWSIILPTLYIILRISNPEILEKLGTMMSWYYLALASIVGAYFGFKSWSSIKGK